MVLKKTLPLILAPLLAPLSACAPPPAAAVDPAMLPGRAPLTVLVFFSTGCHCLAAHDARLVALAGRARPRGVQFFMVDSEVDASDARDQAEAQRRGYPFPMFLDHGAKLANQVGAEYASYSVLLDAQGRILYRGGIDSDKSVLHDDATPYLEDALDDALAGRPPRVAYGKALGCALRKW
jgi:hypothetical protein